MMYELIQDDDDGKFECKFPSQDVRLLEVEEICLQPLPDVKSEPEDIEEDFTKAEPNFGYTMKAEKEETNVLYKIEPFGKGQIQEIEEDFTKAEPKCGCTMKEEEEDINGLYQIEPFAKEQIQKMMYELNEEDDDGKFESKFPSQDVRLLEVEEKCLQALPDVKSEPEEVEEDFTKAEPKYCCTMKTEEEEANVLYQLVPFAKEQIQGLDEIIKNENSANDFNYIKNKEDQKFIRIHDRSRTSSTHVDEVNVEPDRNWDIRVTNYNAPIHNDKGPFTCEECGKSFNHRNGLKTHVLYHTGDRQFSCEMCAKSFNQSSNLKVHLLIHTSNRKFCCEECGKSFKRRSAIKRHMRIHTDDRPFSCEVCGKSFNYRKGLKRHLLNHTGDRPFSCEVCGKSFNRRDSLNAHLIIHTGDHPFSCELCEKSFKQRINLRRHLLTHIGIRPI